MRKICLLAFVFWACLVNGQDHYWSQQYGGEATLTGGTAVVGVNDNSNVYYNPGASGFVDSARITASTISLGLESIRLRNGAGTGLDLKNVGFNILPQLLAGTIVIKKVPKLRLVYGTLTRGRSNINLTQENENSYDVISGSPGNEYYKARVEYINNSLEQWAGAGVGYKINETWSVGLSIFGAYTHMEVRSTENVNADATAKGVPYTTTVNEYNAMTMDQVTHMFKLGVAARFKQMQLGISLTPPGIKVWGQGRLEKSFEVYNLNQNAIDTTVPAQKNASYVISDVQAKLKTAYRIPLSAAIGIKLVYPGFTLSAALEYFMGYSSKTILRGTDRAVVHPAVVYGNDTISGFMVLQTAATWVLNGGIGAEVKVLPHLHLLLGARTDFSNHTDYLPGNSILNVSSAASPVWNYMYFSSGIAYKAGLNNLSVGFDYGLGFGGGKQEIYNITEPQQQTYLRGAINQNIKTSVHKLNFILSYTYFFKAHEKRHGPFAAIGEGLKQTEKKK